MKICSLRYALNHVAQESNLRSLSTIFHKKVLLQVVLVLRRGAQSEFEEEEIVCELLETTSIAFIFAVARNAVWCFAPGSQ